MGIQTIITRWGVKCVCACCSCFGSKQSNLFFKGTSNTQNSPKTHPRNRGFPRTFPRNRGFPRNRACHPKAAGRTRTGRPGEKNWPGQPQA